MQTVQLSDGAGDYVFDIDDLVFDDGGHRVRVKSAYDTHGHTFLLREDMAGSFFVNHGADPQVRVRIDGAGGAQRLRAGFAAEDDDDVAGHATNHDAVFSGTFADDDDVAGHAGSRQQAATAALSASSAYVILWQLAAASEPTQQLVTLGGRCASC